MNAVKNRNVKYFRQFYSIEKCVEISNIECERCIANIANDKHWNDSTEKLRTFDSNNPQQTDGQKDANTEKRFVSQEKLIGSRRFDTNRHVYQIGDSRRIQIVWKTNGNQ